MPGQKERCRQWRESHKEEVKINWQRWYAAHSKERNLAAKKWRRENPERVIATTKAWRDQNPEKVVKYRNKARVKYRGTKRGQLNLRISNSINASLRKGIKRGRHWETLVGYTAEQLKIHLEKQFIYGMTWEHFMKGEIHIDHKIPVTAFNFETAEDIDFKKCWALSNLQPMWAKDNLTKQNKIIKPFQPSLNIKI